MIVLGLTGGIASGKSTVSKRLVDAHNAVMIDADAVAFELAEPHMPLWDNYVKRYGAEVALNDNGTLNRDKIGEIVFSDAKERQWMDEMAHPLIKAEILSRLEKLKINNCKIVVLDVPLLFEVHWDKMCDIIWLVYVDMKTQLARLMARNDYTCDIASQRIASQMPMEKKKALADVVIDNNDSIEKTLQFVDEEWAKIINS